MKKASNWALEKGIYEVILEVYEKNKNTINFYENIGYSTLKRIMNIRLNNN